MATFERHCSWEQRSATSNLNAYSSVVNVNLRGGKEQRPFKPQVESSILSRRIGRRHPAREDPKVPLSWSGKGEGGWGLSYRSWLRIHNRANLSEALSWFLPAS